jgi:pimeloyl-ACP methyl ester carboxylesterase
MSVPRNLHLSPEVAPSWVEAPSGPLAALVATPPAASASGCEVLAVPGYTGSKEDFLHLLPLLSRAGYRVTAIDLRGQYESGGPDDPNAYTLAALSADVAALVSELSSGADRPVHLIGHSFGGLVCRDAVLAGAPVESLTLLCSGPGALSGTRADLVELMRSALVDQGLEPVLEASEAIAAADPASADVPPEVRDFLRRRFLASPVNALVGMGIELTAAVDRIDELAACGMPMLVAHGEADDAWPIPEQEQMARRLGARYDVIAHAGHSPAVENPELTASTLTAFWASVDGDTVSR